MTKSVQPTTWSSDLSNGDITMLGIISDDIDKQLDRAAGSFIRIGNLLNQARTMFVGDKEFGQWRANHTAIKSGKTASAYMAVARRFSEHSLAPQVSYSVLRELSSASDEVVEEVRKQVDEGNSVTVKDVQNLKRPAATAAPAPDTVPDATVGPSSASDTRPGTLVAGRPLEGRDGPPVASEHNATPDPDPAMQDGEYLMVALSPDEVRTIVDALLVNPTKESELLAERLKEEL